MPSRDAEHAARQLHASGEPPTVVADHLLDQSDPTEWAIAVMARAAEEAARSGGFDRAATLLARIVEARSAAIDLESVRALIELGRVEVAAGRSSGARRWETAADQLRELQPHERLIALVELGEATYASGLLPTALDHFTTAHRLSDRPGERELVDEETAARVVAGLSTVSLLTGRRHRGVAARLRSVVENTPAYPDLPTRALMASAAGEVALGVDLPAATVHRLIEGALGRDPLPTAVLRPVFEPLSAALSLTGRPDAAVDLLDAQLELAAAHNDIVAHVSLLPLRAHAHLLADRLEAARRDARDAIDLIAATPGATRVADAPARYTLTIALIELDQLADAEAVCDVADHRVRWGDTPMHGWFLDGLARVHATAHRHDEAVRSWREAARAFTLVGGSGIICEWRDGMARSLLATGDFETARELAAEQIDLAGRFGDARMVAISQATAAAADADHHRAADRLGVALAALPRHTSELTRCRLGLERGQRLRRAGLRRAARDQLAASHATASRLGAHRLARMISTELVTAGAAGRTSVPGRGDVLTRTERETAELAASGLANPEIARRRSVSRKTVEAQLSSVYRKLGLTDRSQLHDALEGSVTDPATGAPPSTDARH